jgi:hypothetical protein
MSAIMPKDSALLIGVGDYRAYDASNHQPPGTSDLAGSLNDVRAWLRLCKEVGIREVRILSSPPLDLAEEGVEVREATAEELRAGVSWLAGQLGGAPADAAPIGLLVFSGHGAETVNEGLVLCPTDTVAVEGELARVVSLVELQGVLASAGAERNLTVVLDCCHDGSAAVHGGHRVSALRPRPATAAVAARPRLGERMFYAASPGEPAYQVNLGVNGDEAHGAFTWAFLTAKGRWSMVPQGATQQLTISYGRMRDATRDLLRALEVEQTPEFEGTPGTAGLPIFHRGLTASPQETSPTPDGESRLKQCDPGIWDYRIYTFMQGLTKIGDMLVARTQDPQNRYSRSLEYWFMRNVPQSTATTTVSMVDYPWSTSPPDPNTKSFTMVQDATWVNRGPSNATDPLLVNGDRSIGIQWKLALSSGIWSGSIIWSRSAPPPGTGLNTLFAGPAQTQTFTLFSSVPSTLTYNTNVPVR